jgi:hypothetical protein
MLDLLKKLFSSKPAPEAKTTVGTVPLTTQYAANETKPVAKKRPAAKKKPAAAPRKKPTKQS